MIKLVDLFKAISQTCPNDTSVVLSEAAIDSRQVIPGALFVALPGERTDGHNFIGEAFKRGATVALVQQNVSDRYPLIDLRSGNLPQDAHIPTIPFCILVEDSLKALQQAARFWRRSLNIKVVGITGSVGKSTTKEMVASVLSQRFATLKSPGNFNNEIGLPLTILRLGTGHERAVLEMGFYVPGEIAFLCDLALPEIGVVTNIGMVHAERAGSQDEIARGKTELVQALPPNGVAILNMDDPRVKAMAHKTQAQVLFYGLDPQATLWADQIQGMGLDGISFQLHYLGKTIEMQLPVIGQHYIYTILRAAAVGLVNGLSWEEIANGLRQGQSQLRLVAVHAESGALLLDDTYNAAPESTIAALNLLGEMGGRKVAVLGDMYELGPYEKHGHELVGERAAQVCDELVAVGSTAKIIAETAQNAGLSPSVVNWLPTVSQAIDYLKGRLQSGDVVLIKGSHGLHMERIVSALEITDKFST